VLGISSLRGRWRFGLGEGLMRVLVTGNAGFIGYHVARRLLERGDTVVGFDVVNAYYDPSLKQARLAQLEALSAQLGGDYRFVRGDLADRAAVENLFADQSFDRVIHLAAQAGIRFSLEDPHSYVQSNVVGFTHILEACRHHKIGHLTYASTSSVYGGNAKMPYSEHDGADHPLQIYAATKRANELMAHSYSHLFGLPTTGLRFFTVYGPWGRPDMALFKFTRNILAGEPIDVYNFGNHTRDFTYIDDIVEGVIRASDAPAQSNADWRADDPDPASSNAPYRIFNIGNADPVKLAAYIDALEDALGKKAIRNLLPLQSGDMADTSSDTSELTKATGYAPQVSVREGVRRFVAWYRAFYSV
jgi:UDP-glucuronate 4-epimerase